MPIMTFLEISSESGIQGGISYYLVILIPLFFYLKNVLIILKKNEEAGYDFMFIQQLLYIFLIQCLTFLSEGYYSK